MPLALVDPKKIERHPLVSPPDDSVVYPDLLRLLRHSEWLPAVRVKVEDGVLQLVGGAHFLRVARDLARPAIRASITQPVPANIECIPGFQSWVSDELLAEEARQVWGDDWHVFGLSKPLDTTALSQLRCQFDDFLDTSIGVRTQAWCYDEGSRCLEIMFRVPLGDHLWIGRYLDFVRSAFADVGGLTSFQGRRFDK